MSSIAPQIHTKTASEYRNGQISLAGKMASGESLTGTPTASSSPTGPTIDNVAVSVAELTINGEAVAAGQALTYRISGGTAGTEYTITFTSSTNSSPAQTLQGIVKLVVES